MITQTLHIRQVCCKMAQFLVEQLQQEAKDAEKMLVKRAMKEMIPMQLDKEAKLSARRAVAISAMAACHLGQPLTRPINQSLSKALSCKLSTDLARGYVKPPAPPAAVSSMRPSGDGPKRRVSQKQLGALAAQAGAQAPQFSGETPDPAINTFPYCRPEAPLGWSSAHARLQQLERISVRRSKPGSTSVPYLKTVTNDGTESCATLLAFVPITNSFAHTCMCKSSC